MRGQLADLANLERKVPVDMRIRKMVKLATWPTRFVVAVLDKRLLD